MRYAFYPGCAYHGAAGYPQSVRAVTRAVGVELVEVPDWNCCGATASPSRSKAEAALLVARNAALVKKAGFDQVITVCNACTVSLRKGLEYLKKDDDLRARAIRRLAEEGLELPDALAVRHLIEVFMTDLPADRWTWVGAPPLPDWTVAAYAGCQFNRPWADVDDAEQPMLLDRFIERIGFKVVDHPARTWCCGAALGPLYPDARERLIRRILTAAQGADVLATLCPLCQFNLDAGQAVRPTPAPSPDSPAPTKPVLFFTQLAGLALGITPKELGLNRLLIPIQRGR